MSCFINLVLPFGRAAAAASFAIVIWQSSGMEKNFWRHAGKFHPGYVWREKAWKYLYARMISESFFYICDYITSLFFFRDKRVMTKWALIGGSVIFERSRGVCLMYSRERSFTSSLASYIMVYKPRNTHNIPWKFYRIRNTINVWVCVLQVGIYCLWVTCLCVQTPMYIGYREFFRRLFMILRVSVDINF